MSARFIVGDTRAVTATLPDGSVELIMSSPPYLALRSYLPADHPSKHLEIGSEGTPAEFIDVLLALTAEWRRVLNPRTGSIVIELGDTYAGSGGAGGDYLENGLREGQPTWQSPGSRNRHANTADAPSGQGLSAAMIAHEHSRSSSNARTAEESSRGVDAKNRGNTSRGTARRQRENLDAWPRPKSATMIPESYRWALAYGRNPFTGQESPAGRWQIRNTITRCSPNPPVGALGKKWRPATTDLVVATPDDDRRYWDDVATRVAHRETNHRPLPKPGDTERQLKNAANIMRNDVEETYNTGNPAGAPLLDWWQIVAGGYPGAHYAVYPPELCEPFIEAMCPRRVCLTCGEPSRRETSDPTYEQNGVVIERPNPIVAVRGATGGFSVAGTTTGTNSGLTRQTTTTGWTTCGHPGTDGLMMDGYHMGTGWRPGIVLDPFAGTGTTLAVATGHGRDAIGIDLDPRNADLALNRVGPLLLTIEHHDEPVEYDGDRTTHNSLGNHPRIRTGYVDQWNPRPRRAPNQGLPA